MRVTACSIVKNEEKNITRSIESYKEVVDEIIIVDTGSTDKTVDISKALGAKTLFFDWNNDFSAAKNFALDHATGDWIIFLDADEWFEPKLQKKLITNMLKNINNKFDALIVEMFEFDNIKNKVISNEVTVRIFRNEPRIRYSGRIHERLTKDGKELKLARSLDLKIYHSGYSSNILTHKAKRNLDILNNIYAQGDVNTSLLFYMFRENYLLNKEDSIKYFDLFMKQPDADKEIQRNNVMICIYELMYKVMVNLSDKFNETDIYRLLKTAYDKYPGIPMHSYLIGCEYIKQKKLKEAINWIDKALVLNSDYTGHLSNSFAACKDDAYYNLGCIYQELGKSDEALTFFIRASNTSNMDILLSTLPKIFDIIKFQPQEEIILFLDSVLDVKKKEIIEGLLKILKNVRLHKVLIYYAIKYNKEFDGQDETTYIAMILTEKADIAVETAISAYNRNKDRELNQVIWHLDYALIGIMYLKDTVLYDRYKSYFNKQTNTIINAYISGQKLLNMSEDLSKEFKKIFNMICNIFPQSDIDKYSKMAI